MLIFADSSIANHRTTSLWEKYAMWFRHTREPAIVMRFHDRAESDQLHVPTLSYFAPRPT